MNNKRLNRISEEVRRVVSELIYNGLKDPRINEMTTIVKVEVTRDLSFANIYASVLGDEKDKENTLIGLNNAKGFIRSEIAKKIDLRYAPEPIFHLDESIERGIYLSKLIDEVNKNDSRNKEDFDE
ncbi:MAG TPA: 30S ribosome-binding factor RbfA [Tissierellaceae bacterium]|nr:30S ribosome-binding factor RbfA [Tissierellaceae bacterium]